MPTSPIRVYIVDDNASVCASYARLMLSEKMRPQTFSSVEDLLKAELDDSNACVVSDIELPGQSGAELPGLLSRSGHHLPVIFVTSKDTSQARDLAQRHGAAAYFSKPVDSQALLDAIHWALSCRAIR